MWSFERKFVAPEEVDAGPVPEKWLTFIWLAIFGGMLGVMFGGMSVKPYGLDEVHTSLTAHFSMAHGLLFIPIALIFARLAALDLCYLLLLNIYTMPLLVAGVLYHLVLSGLPWQESLLGALVAAGLGFLLSFIMMRLNKQEGEFGLGDVKMLAVMGIWVGATTLPFALALAFMANLVLSFFISSRQPLPFGFGLVVGTWVLVAAKKPFMEMLFYLAA